MSNGSGSNRGPIEIPGARTGLNAFLTEIASEFGIPDYFERDQGDFPARVHGYIGGNSVRAFSYFAQNFLRSLPPEQGAQLLKQYGLHIPHEEKKRVREYLDKMGYQPTNPPMIVDAAASAPTQNPVDPQLLQSFIPGSEQSGAQMNPNPTFGQQQAPGNNIQH